MTSVSARWVLKLVMAVKSNGWSIILSVMAEIISGGMNCITGLSSRTLILSFIELNTKAILWGLSDAWSSQSSKRLISFLANIDRIGRKFAGIKSRHNNKVQQWDKLCHLRYLDTVRHFLPVSGLTCERCWLFVHWVLTRVAKIMTTSNNNLSRLILSTSKQLFML